MRSFAHYGINIVFSLCLSVCVQFVLSRGGAEDVHMDTQSCADHSILAIFEDSTVPSEVSVTSLSVWMSARTSLNVSQFSSSQFMMHVSLAPLQASDF